MNKKYFHLLWGLLIFVAPIQIFVWQNRQEKPPILPKNLQVITADNARRITSLLSPEGNTKSISFSPDGSMAAISIQYLDFDYNVSVIEVKSGNEISHIQGRMDSFQNLTWSPDGKKIAIISTRITGSGVEIRSVKTYTVKKGLNHNYYAMGNSDTWYTDEVNISSDKVNSPVKVIWNPTATMLAVAFHDKFDIYDVNANNKLFSEPSTDLKTINWSPDGKVIITQNGDNTISLWGVTSDS